MPQSQAKPKTLSNSTVNGAKKNVKDLVVYGDGDMFKLLCKASSESEGWMKSTKAMHIPGQAASSRSPRSSAIRTARTPSRRLSPSSPAFTSRRSRKARS